MTLTFFWLCCATLCAGHFGKDQSNIKAATIKVAFKPLRTLNRLFPRPKAKERVDQPQSVTVYKISCTNCSFVYYSQTERSLKTRIVEHKRAVSMFDPNSKISCHVHENCHEMNFGNARVVGHEANYHERLFLEAWISVQDPQSGNDHIAIAGSPSQRSTNLWLAHKSHATFSRNVTRFSSARLTGCYLNHAC